MLLDQPVILAIDGAWKRFVRVVGSLGDSPAPASEPPVEVAPWSSADWQRSLDLLAAAPTRAGQGSTVGLVPSGPPSEPGVPAAPSVTDENEDGYSNAAVALSDPVNGAAGDMPAASAASVNSDAVSGRRVDAALMRAVLLSGQGRLDEAASAFAEAIALDPALDLAAAPAFWSLGRGGQEAAVRALEGAGRARDAMILRSRIENRYRPRLVRSA